MFFRALLLVLLSTMLEAAECRGRSEDKKNCFGKAILIIVVSKTLFLSTIFALHKMRRSTEPIHLCVLLLAGAISASILSLLQLSRCLYRGSPYVNLTQIAQSGSFQQDTITQHEVSVTFH